MSCELLCVCGNQLTRCGGLFEYVKENGEKLLIPNSKWLVCDHCDRKFPGRRIIDLLSNLGVSDF